MKNTITLEEGRRIFAEQRERRAANFALLVSRGVFGNPASPYLRLMQQAGITLADFEAMVSRDGIEPTLQALYREGVYVTFDEYKGRKPLVRGSLTLEVAPVDFENPYTARQFYTTSGGTTGAGTRIGQDLDLLRMLSVLQNLAYSAHGVFHVPTALWRGILPDGSGVNNTLKFAAFGHVPEAWFSPNRATPFKRGYLKHALASYLFVVASRLYGVPVAWPQYVPLKDAEVVARWAEKTLKKHGRCFIMATASRGLRVALAAEEAGINLSGAIFALAGEPVTQSKVDGIARVGGKVFTTYGTSETGRIGLGCADPVHHTDVHVNTAMFAVNPQLVDVPSFPEPVTALCTTTLHPAAPFIFLNYLSDDYGTIERRECGCALGELGLDQHIHHIYSYSKLTGEGVTLVGSVMIRVLEEVLPARFGGSPLDYQLLEEEDERGYTRLSLLISPQVKLLDEVEVVETIVDCLKQDSVMGGIAGGTWEQAGTFRIRRSEPIWTARGKFLPIHKIKRA